jgi:receptor protein-tyrosine kinase
MSRVHDALRRAEGTYGMAAPLAGAGPAAQAPAAAYADNTASLHGLLEQVKEVPWDPAMEAHLIDATKPHEGPVEEFRSLRTRLNHLQGLQPLHTMVITSASPAEGKSFTAANLALAQSHLQGQSVLLCDFDFRRPIVHNLFKLNRAPGLTEYLQGRASLAEVVKRVAGTNLYVAPAGSAVINPLELLNLKEVRVLLERLPALFNWVIIDSPPLLFAADANLLATLCDGTLLVVRLGKTTIESVTRALGSMSHNNVIGVVANAAKRGELYSKYTYYHNYYYSDGDSVSADPEAPQGSANT